MNKSDWAGLADFNFDTTATLIKISKERDELKQENESNKQLITQQTADITRLKAEIEQLKKASK